MKKILLLTGVSEIDKTIQQQIKGNEYFTITHYHKNFYNEIEKFKPDFIFITETFNSYNINEILIGIKKTKSVKIVYVSIDATPKNSHLLHELSISNIFYGSFKISDLAQVFHTKKD